MHTSEGLVEKENAWPVNHSRSESEFLLHDVGIVRNHGLGPIGKLHEIEQLVSAALGCRAVQPVHLADELQILRAGQALEEAHAFGHNANLAFYLDRIRGKIESKKLHAAGSRS